MLSQIPQLSKRKKQLEFVLKAVQWMGKINVSIRNWLVVQIGTWCSAQRYYVPNNNNQRLQISPSSLDLLINKKNYYSVHVHLNHQINLRKFFDCQVYFEWFREKCFKSSFSYMGNIIFLKSVELKWQNLRSKKVFLKYFQWNTDLCKCMCSLLISNMMTVKTGCRYSQGLFSSEDILP